MKKLLYLSLIILNISSVAHADNWFTRWFGFGRAAQNEQGDDGDADRAADILMRGNDHNRRNNIDIFDGLSDHDRQEAQKEAAKHHYINNADLNPERARQLGEFDALREKSKHAASPSFVQRIPGQLSAGALDAIRDLAGKAGVAGGRIIFKKALAAYADKNISPEDRAFYENLEQIQAEKAEIEKRTLFLLARAELIKANFQQEAIETELAKLEKMEQERLKKKAEKAEAELAHQVAIAEQQGPIAG